MESTRIALYLWCLLGVLISVVLPGLWAYVRERFPASPGAQPKSMIAPSGLVELIRPYAALGLASSLTAILVMAFAGDSLTDYRAGLLIGYAWDSTLQKLK